MANAAEGRVFPVGKLAEFVRLTYSIDFSDQDSVEPKLHFLLQQLVNDPSDWGSYCDHDVKQYCRYQLYKDANVTILLVYFPPGVGNKIHDHGGSKYLCKVLEGNLVERQYRTVEEARMLQWHSTSEYTVNAINGNTTPKQIHCFKNNSDEMRAVSLVVYYPSPTEINWYDEPDVISITQKTMTLRI